MVCASEVLVAEVWLQGLAEGLLITAILNVLCMLYALSWGSVHAGPLTAFTNVDHDALTGVGTYSSFPSDGINDEDSMYPVTLWR